MPTTSKTKKPAAKAAPKRKAKPTPAKGRAASPPTKTTAKAPAAPKSAARAKAKGETMSLAEVMKFLEKSGSEQARKTYTRHGATGPMFGVAFGTLSTLQKRIRVDHELALKLWETGNVDARNLAMKIADPAAISSSDLDRWARENPMRMCGLYIGSLAQESGQGLAKAKQWLASSDERLRGTGWTLVSVLASRDDQSPDDVYARYLAQIEKSIHSEANEVKAAMNGALIAIGCRTAALRKAATAAAKRIGKVDVDHGDTSCETPDAASYIDKTWARLQPKFPTPAAAERSRDSMRTRC
jgi:3-methyladenine DNA glycosylase AlkD